MGTYLFRVDANAIIGHGHVARCTSLARQIKELDNSAECIFLSRENTRYENTFPDCELISIINLKRIDNDNYSALEECNDAYESLKIISNYHDPIVIVDSYDLGIIWEGMVSKFSKLLVVICDIPSKPHECDMLVNQNYNSENSEYYKNYNKTTLLLGSKYSILPSKYKDLKKKSIIKKDIYHVMISFGGVDSRSITLLTLQSLIKYNKHAIKIYVTISDNHSNYKEIRNISSKHNNVELHVNCNDLTALYEQIDIAFGNCGASLWERMAYGIPSFIISVTQIQKEIALSLYDSRFIFYIGHWNSINSINILESFDSVMQNPVELTLASKNVSALIDGRGSERVSKYILQKYRSND